jgi:hypothetical protein
VPSSAIGCGPNATVFAPEQGIGLVAYVAGGDLGDSFTMRLVDPSGDITDSVTVPFTEPLGQTVWVTSPPRGVFVDDFGNVGRPAKRYDPTLPITTGKAIVQTRTHA